MSWGSLVASDRLDIVEHVCENVFGVLESLGHLHIVAVECLV